MLFFLISPTKIFASSYNSIHLICHENSLQDKRVLQSNLIKHKIWTHNGHKINLTYVFNNK